MQITVNRSSFLKKDVNNEKEERHQNLHLQNLFILEKATKGFLESCSARMSLCYTHRQWGPLFSRTLLSCSFTLDTSSTSVSLTSKIYLFGLLRDPRRAKYVFATRVFVTQRA